MKPTKQDLQMDAAAKQYASKSYPYENEARREFAKLDFAAGVRWADQHPLYMWISTKDQLPEIPDNRVYSDFVLIAYGKLTYIARVDRWRRWSGEDLENMRRPDYWMPIPPIPDKQ